jgi:hypothetical protein
MQSSGKSSTCELSNNHVMLSFSCIIYSIVMPL